MESEDRDDNSGRLAEELVDRALEPFKNDSWISRRLQLDEVISRIEETLKAKSGELGANSSRLQATLLDWIRFVEFLRDQCSGREYSGDKQWGQLMNLMGVSRKLNHRSAKFRDIIKNKQLIQANAGDIRKFNESVRFQANIEGLIKELRANIGSCQLVMLLDTTDGNSSIATNQQRDRSKSEPSVYNAAAVVEEITKCRHNLDSTCGPIIYGLSVQLKTSSNLEASNNLDSTNSDNSWTGEFAELNGKFDRLCQFLTGYQSLNAKLAHLSPLVKSFSNQNEANEAKTDIKFSSGSTDLLQNSLALCRQKFNQVLDFCHKLNANLLTLASHQQKGPATIKVNKSSSSQNRQQAASLQLVKLLTAKNEFTSDLYSTRLTEALGLLTECQAILDQVIQSLRLEYGRFYFINDLELLTIISLDSKLVSQCHLPENKSLISKIFNQSIEGFTLVEQQDGQLYISGIVNAIGEKIMVTSGGSLVPLKKRVNIYSLEIVRILNEILRKLRASLRQIFINSLEQSLVNCRFESLKSPQNDIDWSLPVQLLELVEQTKFTHRVEWQLNETMQKQASDNELLSRPTSQFDRLLSFYEARLESLRSMSELAASDDERDRGESKQQLIKLKVSVSVSATVHFLSILMKLQKSGVSSPLDWNWFKLPRYYYNRSNDEEHGTQLAATVQIRMANTSFAYKFDLLPVEVAYNQALALDQNSTGDGPKSGQHFSVKRLIATETSERCFLVASQSVSALKLGASLFGPAGSGKTETIKALGHMVGCQVIVHNCDETNESDALKRLVWGLAHTGLWGCFDEFNRLSSNTLSSVSEVLELVQTNLRLKRTNVELDDGQIKSIDPDSAFFITLNPGDSFKYRGRRRLPANLRALFLPIAMVRVQIDAIVSGMLLVFSASEQLNQTRSSRHELTAAAASGICQIDAKISSEIGQKVAIWIDWTREHFKDCPSNRCEWDLRLVMVILKRFKILVLNRANALGGQLEASSNTLEDILVKSIRCEVEPRLTSDEARLLDQSIERCFGVSGGLSTASDKTRTRTKSVQFNEQLKLRPGVILLGKTRSGKSTCWRTQLEEANAVCKVVHLFALNPKSYDKHHLFGYFDSTTHKWIDGVFTKLVRDSLNLLQTNRSARQIWIVLDGAVDPDWIECLNSVLDDNQVLTLSSGERLNFVESRNKCIKLIIETNDIKYASPATISRLGLVYCETTFNPAQGLANKAPVTTSNLVIVHGGSNFRLRSLVGKQYCQQQLEGALNCVEYNCGELSTSEHLIEILMQNPTTTTTIRNHYYLLNNLDLIQGADKWDTRTLIELLRYVITYKCYYDTNMNRIGMGDNSKFIITLSGSLSGLNDDRLLSLGHVIEVDDADSRSQQVTSMEPIAYESLDDFLDVNPFGGRPEESVRILLLNTMNVMEVTKQTCEMIQGKPTGRIELFRFNKRNAQVRSMDKLARLTATATATATATSNQSNYPSNTETDDGAVVFLLNSFELKFIQHNVKRDLYHLANKLRAMNAPRRHQVVFLVYYMNPDCNLEQSKFGSDLDYDFWLSMAEEVHVVQEGELNGARLRKVLADKLKDDRHAPRLGQIDWLADQVGNLFNNYQASSNNTATSRDSFMTMLVDMIVKLSENVDSQQRLLSNGLDKLNEFEASVERIESQRKAENESLARKKLELESLMRQIEAEMKDSEQKRVESKELELLQQVKSDEIAVQSRKIQLELSQVLPLIEQSKQDVGKSLKPEALNEIKTLRSPPKTIKDILDVLFIFLGVNDTSWSVVKTYLNKYSLRDELTNYNFEQRLTKSLLVKIEQEIKLRHDSFQMQQAKRASSAIVPILKWIEAAIQYGRVLILLSPLKQGMQRLEHESSKVSDSMSKLEEERVQLDAKIEQNRARLEELDKAYCNARQVSEQISDDLDKARDVIRDSNHQTQRWRSKLKLCKKLSTDTRELYRLSLVCSSVAIFGDKLHNLTKLIGLFDSTNIKAGMGEYDALDVFIRVYFNVLMDSCDQDPIDLTRFKQNELHQVVQLASLKLCTHFKHYPLVPCLISDKLQETTADELANLMCLNNIVCSRDDLIILKPLGENSNNWQQLTELALEMNKLILIKICSTSDSSNVTSVLDILDLAMANSKLVLFGNVESATKDHLGCAIVDQIKQVSRPIHVIAQTGKEGPLSGGTFDATITEMLMHYYDPRLSETMSQLEHELQAKQIEAKQLESSLIKRLMIQSTSSRSVAAKPDLAPLRNDLVHVLSNLHQARQSLASNIDGIKEKLNEYHGKQNRFVQVSRKAALFYEQFIANLQSVNQFYSLPLSSYVKILCETKRNNAGGGNRDETLAASIDFGSMEFVNVITHVMCSMRPDYRSIFQANLLAAASSSSSSRSNGNSSPTISPESIRMAATQAANFRQALIEQLVDLSKARRRPNVKQTTSDQSDFKLIVVVHDTKRPSPQVVVDELFRQHKTAIANTECQYYKLYASGNSTGQQDSSKDRANHLESQLLRILCPDSPGQQASATSIASTKLAASFNSLLASRKVMGDKSKQQNQLDNVGQRELLEYQQVGPMKCICVANAHLASTWINSRLMELIREVSSKRGLTDTKLMIILIAESEFSDSSQSESRAGATIATSHEGQFELNLLDRADLKFCYDELALNLCDRFSLYYKLICDTSIYHELNRVERLKSSNSSATVVSSCNYDIGDTADLKTLVKDLVLFHVICQQLAKLSSQKSTLGDMIGLMWQKDYYNFDYEQLCLALKVMKQIVQDDGSRAEGRREQLAADQPVRYLFGHLLETIIYGSRMETLGDEQLLERLLRRLIYNTLAGAARQQLMSFIEKLASSESTGSAAFATASSREVELENANELAKLIGIVSRD